MTLPGAVPLILSGLKHGLIYAMLGVIGAEIIAAEHGVGQTLAYLGATSNMSGFMAVLVVLALLATAVTRGLTGLERRLLRSAGNSPPRLPGFRADRALLAY